MKIVKEITEPGTKVKDIFCNKCGMSCKGHIGNFNGLIEAEVTGQYDSTFLGDGDVYIFSLCERCVKELIDSFALHAKQGNYLFPEEDNPEGFNRRKYFGEGIKFWSDLSEEERMKWKQAIEKNSTLNHLHEIPRTELILWLYDLESNEKTDEKKENTIKLIKEELRKRDKELP